MNTKIADNYFKSKNLAKIFLGWKNFAKNKKNCYNFKNVLKKYFQKIAF